MKAYISVDMEGMPYIVSSEHLGLKGLLYEEARKIMTEIVVISAESLHKNGFEKVVVADSHGPMVSIIPDALPEYVDLVRGTSRPVSMTSGIESCDAALFLGYHAKAGTSHSTFDHTYSSYTIDSLELNNIKVSEFLLNAYVAGHYNIPVILVGGEEKLIEEDVKKFSPATETVVFKKSYSRYSSISNSFVKIRENLKESIAKAAKNFMDGKTKALTVKTPIEFKIRFLHTDMADMSELLPFIERVDGKTVKYVAKDIIEGYKIFEALVELGIQAHPST
jgi:D-amino peptidase